MRTIVILLLSMPLIVCGETTEQTKIGKTLSSWEQQAGEYPGDNPDLSGASKRAIVLGNPDMAVQPYLKAYNSEYGRKRFGVESLYQIFLVYIDPYNTARDIKKAKKYLDQMITEWPKTKQTQKAKALYAKYNS